MFTSMADFEQAFKTESGNTLKMFKALTDESLGQSVTEGHRTIGRVAWHIVQTIPDMMGQTGLKVDFDMKKPVPKSANEISQAYESVSKALLDQVKSNWTDDDLQKEDDLYGEKWKRGLTLMILITHEVHHRGQMTVLMRQAGLKVPGIYGPSMEEWKQYGQEAPAI